MKLYFVRHGESEGNVLKIFYGRGDYPLTERGREQAKALAERLKDIEIERCVASPLIRALDTAKIICEPKELTPELHPGMVEQDMGELEGISILDMLAETPERVAAMLKHWSRVTPPGGEAYADMKSRISAVLDEVIASDRDTLIVAHNGSLSVAMGIVLNLPDDVAEGIVFEQGRWTAIDINEHRNRLICFNR